MYSLQIRQEKYSREFTQLKNSTKINHDLIIDLLFCFVTKMMSIVLSINIEDRRQKAKELVLENCNMATPYEQKNVLVENVSSPHFIDSKRA